MEPGPLIPEERLVLVRQVCRVEPCLAALYVLELDDGGDYNLAALYSESPAWPERLDLELAVAKALGLDGVELIDLKRMPLVFRFNVIDRGQPLYVGKPEVLAEFIEHTIARYAAFYPLLEALYWTVETKPLAEDRLDDGPAPTL